MTARRLPVLAGLLLAMMWVSMPVLPSDQPQPMCHKLERDMQRLRSRMRQGYSNRQGERHRSRMRRLKTRYYKRCRPSDR